jgi:hypothetical protein
MGNFNDKDLDLAKRAAEKLHLPFETQRCIKLLRELNIFGFRKLLKTERQNLPSKYKRLYKDSDDKLLLAMHYLRTVYPFFTKEERSLSEKYIDLQQQLADGIDPTANKIH